MLPIRSWMFLFAALFVLGNSSMRAEDEEPSLRGKKISEWIEQLQNGKTIRDRQAALLAVQAIGPRKSRKVTPALIGSLRENSEELIRAGSARALGYIAAKARFEDDVPIEKVRDALAVTLRADKAPSVRRAAAKALGEMKVRAQGAVEVLALALKDTDAGTRMEAAAALQQLGKDAEDALDELQAALKDAKLERLMRVHCAHALGRIGSAQAVPSLRDVLAEVKTDGELRRACAEALGQLGKQAGDAVPALAAALTAKDSDLGLRRAAAEALDRMGADAYTALPALRTALKDDDQFVRTLSLHAAGQMGRELGDERKPMILGILAAMDDNVLEVRVAAIEALGNIGGANLGELNQNVIDKLTAATRDPQKAVAEASRVALKKLQGSV
jgi:HEAT repeat protein